MSNKKPIEFVENEDYCEFYVKKRINDQIVEIVFQGDIDRKEEYCYWNIGLAVYDDRSTMESDFDNLIGTGRQGISTLLFAKQAVQDFEKFIVRQYGWIKNILCAGWGDEKRHKVYRRGLLAMGYVEELTRYPSDMLWDSEMRLVKRLY